MKTRITVIVTRPSGSWRWQKAYALSTYEADHPNGPWRFVERSGKFARTRATEHLWTEHPTGRPTRRLTS